MLRAAASGDLDTLILIGADPLSDFPDRNLAAEAIQKVKTLSPSTHLSLTQLRRLMSYYQRLRMENKEARQPILKVV